MTRKIATHTLTEPNVFYTKMLHWANQCNIFCLLHSSNSNANYISQYDWLMAVDTTLLLETNIECLATLQSMDIGNDWWFGHMSYHLKNEIETLESDKENKIGFATISFFQPKVVLYKKGDKITIECIANETDTVLQAIQNIQIPTQHIANKVHITPQETKAQYIATINKLKEHIQRGDCYEINYCTSFYDNNATIEPITTFLTLQDLSPTPFTAFYKNGQSYVLCASPERYLCKQENTLISQPIKGTIKRDLQNTHNDALLKQQLYTNKKEQSENIMTVDLVRNDLSKICHNVNVTNFLEVISFPQVHHLVSTIEGTLNENTTFADIIKATFPMGSMTGAPKKKVMELIDTYEAAARGLFSGTIGYIAPNGNFDFNVVIRSILYNAQANYLCYYVGSGITSYCNAESEYEECLLKANAMATVLG